jgi:inositol transport system permease protein
VVGVLIRGVMTSGITCIRNDAYYQEMVKGAIIVAAVVADQYRNQKKRR